MTKTKLPPKPTIFLSHSSRNHRELLALQRLLNERAADSIEFFLSSDDHSIPHGTIWSAEVKEALDRMTFMLVFASIESLESSWTYFEAGYGLNKLRAVHIYCLPGTQKDKLPPPFNLLQNRNLHSAHDLKLLIQQINGALDRKLNDSVTKQDFDSIFAKKSVVRVKTGPSFQDLVKAVIVKATGPGDSMEIFSRVCVRLSTPDTAVPEPSDYKMIERFSSGGVRLGVSEVRLPMMEGLIEITQEARERGEMEVYVRHNDQWSGDDDLFFGKHAWKTVGEVETHNSVVRERNEKAAKERERILAQPRKCEFLISPRNLDISIATVDEWLSEAEISQPKSIHITLKNDFICEHQVHEIGAKIFETPISLRENGTLSWPGGFEVILPSQGAREIVVRPPESQPAKLADFNLLELVTTLSSLEIILPFSGGRSKKR